MIHVCEFNTPPPPAPYNDPAYYTEGIRNLVLSDTTHQFMCSSLISAKPAWLPNSRWAQFANVYDPYWYSPSRSNALYDGDRLAEYLVYVLFGLPPSDPQYRGCVMLNEIGDDPYIHSMIKRAAEALVPYRSNSPRWGAFLINGRNVDFEQVDNQRGVLTALLDANAMIGVEMYVYQKLVTYMGSNADQTNVFCTQASAQRENYLKAYFAGGAFGAFNFRPRSAWLWARRNSRSSGSKIFPVFPAYDRYVNWGQSLPDSDPSKVEYRKNYLDYMMYVWRQVPSIAPMIRSTIGGGAGSYVWQGPAADPRSASDPFGQVDIGRDNEFRDSWLWYSRDYNASLRRTGARC